jgi:hypothetical protein
MTTGRPWSGDEPDPGLTEPLRAIRDAIPTSRHARMLFEMVADLLGERAVVETFGERTRLSLFRRDAPDTIVPWPLLRLGTKGRLSAVMMLIKPPGAPDEPPPRPGEPPRLRNLGPGEVEIHDGPHSITVTYGDDGRWMETSRSESPDALEGVLPALALGSARPVELLAEYVACLDIARHGPGRVVCPAPVPCVEGLWRCGLLAVRGALFGGRIPERASWAIADGYDGTAISWGATREEAHAAWSADVKHAPRSPHTHEPGAADAPVAGAMGFRGPSSDTPWPEPAPENTPFVVIPLEWSPRPPSPWGSWMRLVGGFGGTFRALMRRDPTGFTLVGDRLADLVDLHDLDERLDAVEIFDHPALRAAREARRGDRPAPDSGTVIYRVVDDRTRTPVTPSVVESRQGCGFDPAMLDGDQLRWRVVRHRRLA